MSQNWHAHWMEENYKPTRLGNWEVPKWYPQWPDRHCRKTIFQCDNKGHLLAHLKKTNHERDNFKTTWELPKKISRQLAQELSAPSKYRIDNWKNHEIFHRTATCNEKKLLLLSSSRNGEKLEKILTKRSLLVQNEAKPEPFEPEANNEKLTTRRTTISDNNIEKKDLNENEKKISNSYITESNQLDEKNLNKVVCRLHQTCKI